MLWVLLNIIPSDSRVDVRFHHPPHSLGLSHKAFILEALHKGISSAVHVANTYYLMMRLADEKVASPWLISGGKPGSSRWCDSCAVELRIRARLSVSTDAPTDAPAVSAGQPSPAGRSAPSSGALAGPSRFHRGQFSCPVRSEIWIGLHNLLGPTSVPGLLAKGALRNFIVEEQQNTFVYREQVSAELQAHE